MPRHIHLVGSLGLKNVEDSFRTASAILGEKCLRFPDGEPGVRGNWIMWQEEIFARSSAFDAKVIEHFLPGQTDPVKITRYALKEEVKPDDIALGALGYARQAVDSYAIFERLRGAGHVPPGSRFQVSLPTPAALLCGFVRARDRLALEAVIERVIAAQVYEIATNIPHDRLALQWDVCFEVLGAAGGPPLFYEPALEGSVARVARLCSFVPPDIVLGVHLCYGDPGHRHIVEPKDLSLTVAFANGICEQAARRIDFVHMPVPRMRHDKRYFEPLENLRLSQYTRLVLGLVHFTDGVDGGRRRMAMADNYISDYDIATECGFGRRDPATIPELLRIHKSLCS
jgi:hypothetical protein